MRILNETKNNDAFETIAQQALREMRTLKNASVNDRAQKMLELFDDDEIIEVLEDLNDEDYPEMKEVLDLLCAGEVSDLFKIRKLTPGEKGLFH